MADVCWFRAKIGCIWLLLVKLHTTTVKRAIREVGDAGLDGSVLCPIIVVSMIVYG